MINPPALLGLEVAILPNLRYVNYSTTDEADKVPQDIVQSYKTPNSESYSGQAILDSVMQSRLQWQVNNLDQIIPYPVKVNRKFTAQSKWRARLPTVGHSPKISPSKSTLKYSSLKLMKTIAPKTNPNNNSFSFISDTIPNTLPSNDEHILPKENVFKTFSATNSTSLNQLNVDNLSPIDPISNETHAMITENIEYLDLLSAETKSHSSFFNVTKNWQSLPAHKILQHPIKILATKELSLGPGRKRGSNCKQSSHLNNSAINYQFKNHNHPAVISQQLGYSKPSFERRYGPGSSRHQSDSYRHRIGCDRHWRTQPLRRQSVPSPVLPGYKYPVILMNSDLVLTLGMAAAVVLYIVMVLAMRASTANG